jgi:D-aminopeptidase
MVPHQLRRLAARGGLGLARCGSTGHNGSGELMIAFSTANRIPLESDDGTVPVRAVLDGPAEHSPDVFNPLFAATTEAVEEAVVNALFTAETTVGRDGNVLHALPLERTLDVLARHGRGPR